MISSVISQWLTLPGILLAPGLLWFIAVNTDRRLWLMVPFFFAAFAVTVGLQPGGQEEVGIVQGGVTRRMPHIAIAQAFGNVREGSELLHAGDERPYHVLTLLFRYGFHQPIQKMPFIHEASSFDSYQTGMTIGAPKYR
ncbi:hypothetical protein [Streptomyces sp. P17]|uniref:hypothetical protein n=1 Tax=Streptomyces sp. P17 TaxID=3074716 RepID=UPI0028F425A7|nr:hypothetical protein [Streptomyces sp. P17]MDT9701321.1 hypothetical protein [Streptomyces sp. P17]